MKLRTLAVTVAVAHSLTFGIVGAETATPEAGAISGSLLVYCGAGLMEPVQEIARQFEARTGVKVELSFANSGQLLGQIETSRAGDVYIPGDVGFVAKAQERKLTAGAPLEFCRFVPAIYVRKGNPKAIKDLADLARPGLKLALADPSAAVGQQQAKLFKKNRLDEAALARNTATTPATVIEVALAVKMGTVDAGIIWDALAGFAPDEAEMVRIPAERNVISEVAATVLAGSRNAAAARAFLDSLGSEESRAVLQRMGYTAAGAPASPSKPLLVHVGGTMRPAMEELCALFEKESGIGVELNYNDSGALMTVIETTRKGDVCVVHDPFAAAMERRGLVDRTYTVASLTPVIVVRKGNPKKIAGVKDLVRADVKLALTDAVYSTGGHVVEIIFRKAGIVDAMGKKDIVRSRAGGEVANAVKLGTVDAAIVWNAVAFARKDDLDAIPIDTAVMPDPKADAITSATYGPLDMSCIRVTLMTLKGAGNPEAARRLADLAVSARGRAIFNKLGFSPAPGKPAAP